MRQIERWVSEGILKKMVHAEEQNDQSNVGAREETKMMRPERGHVDSRKEGGGPVREIRERRQWKRNV